MRYTHSGLSTLTVVLLKAGIKVWWDRWIPWPSKLGLGMWKFLAMRYHSASMRAYAHFRITLVKKITILGPFFGLFLIDFRLFLLRILTVFERARASAPQFCSIFDLVFLPTMRIQILSSASHPLMRINPHHPRPATAWPFFLFHSFSTSFEIEIQSLQGKNPIVQ